MWVILAIVGIAAVVAAAALTRQGKTTVEEVGIYRAEVGPELGAFIHAVNHVNSTGDADYVRALEALGKARQEVLADSARLLGEGSDAPFAVRHATLLALAALREPGALDLLSVVALNPQPLPPVDGGKRPAELHGGGALAAGTILSLDALEGIEALADEGFEPALEVLVKAVSVESNAVRGFALTALGANPERAAHFERAKAALPRELAHLAELKRVAVELVAQIEDPRRHLAGLEKGGPSAPLTADRAEAGGDVAPAHGAPRAGGR